MSNKTVSNAELSEPVRSFIEGTFANGGALITDDTGQICGSVVPLKQASPEEKQRTWEDIERIQEQASKSMNEQGVTEDDLDRLLQEDD